MFNSFACVICSVLILLCLMICLYALLSTCACCLRGFGLVIAFWFVLGWYWRLCTCWVWGLVLVLSFAFSLGLDYTLICYCLDCLRLFSLLNWRLLHYLRVSRYWWILFFWKWVVAFRCLCFISSTAGCFDFVFFDFMDIARKFVWGGARFCLVVCCFLLFV